jgi:hypothetical protein
MFLLLHGSVLLFHCIVREGTESLYKGELLYSCCCYLATCCHYPVFTARYLYYRIHKILNVQIIKTEQEYCVLLWVLFIFMFFLSPLVF